MSIHCPIAVNRHAVESNKLVFFESHVDVRMRMNRNSRIMSAETGFLVFQNLFQLESQVANLAKNHFIPHEIYLFFLDVKY
jgi:hypothetical protein